MKKISFEMPAPVYDWPVTIYYEDTDIGGIVYHANYLKYFERARTEWLKSFAIQQQQLIHEQQVMFAVVSMQIDYLKPATLDDVLSVKTALQRCGPASMHFGQKIDCNGELLCRAAVRIGCVHSSTLKPIAIPKNIMEMIYGNTAVD